MLKNPYRGGFGLDDGEYEEAFGLRKARANEHLGVEAAVGKPIRAMVKAPTCAEPKSTKELDEHLGDARATRVRLERERSDAAVVLEKVANINMMAMCR